MILGGVGWLGLFLIGLWLSRIVPPNMELPLAQLSHIAVGGNGQLYCLTPAYSRIQMYDANGRFIWGRWVGPSNSGRYRLDVDNFGLAHVVNSDMAKSWTFDMQGKPKSSGGLSSGGNHGDKPVSIQYASRDVLGNTYEVKNPSIWPEVIKRSISGESTVIVSPRIHLWLVSGPFPAFLFFAAGMIIWFLFRKDLQTVVARA